MRNLMILMVLISTMAFTAKGQKKEVPAKVKTAFTQKFPNATKVEWGRENATEWEAEFKMNAKDYSANYDNNGNWMETEYQVSENELPAAVKSSLSNKYASSKILVAEISETKDGKVYEVLLKINGEKSEVVLSANGKVLKQKEEKDEEGNDEGDEENE